MQQGTHGDYESTVLSTVYATAYLYIYTAYG